MPRVESGQKVLDSSQLLKMGEGELREIREWALRNSPILVTSPSIVYVGLSLPIVVGVGSIISSERPPVGNFREISRTGWVDGCRVGEREPSFERAQGEALKVEGVAVALDPRDPVSLFLNGSRGLHELVVGEEVGAVVTIAGRPAILKLRGYRSLLLSGEAFKRAEYIGPLASSCKGEHDFEDQ
ncbi:MAG: hypothetical protein NZ902_04485 [Acidilobaceae archaeon]|nr:hypothetical protein [Acidilobaceae archaeon]MCX8165012.1 hypothetical protein [Acidilobaceae archaeon]MDW7974471.1 hypothetical protein [Sulfolobales archaeon]